MTYCPHHVCHPLSKVCVSRCRLSVRGVALSLHMCTKFMNVHVGLPASKWWEIERESDNRQLPPLSNSSHKLLYKFCLSSTLTGLWPTFVLCPLTVEKVSGQKKSQAKQTVKNHPSATPHRMPELSLTLPSRCKSSDSEC